MLRIIGQGQLEKPFNRVLKWCADENGTHGFGREFLKHLADLVDLPQMLADLENGSLIEFSGEQAIDSSRNMPDLAVRTDNAALLFENKVNAGESGGDQYQRYSRLFKQFASNRKGRLVLSARDDERSPPDNWTFISHARMAKMFRKLGDLPQVPIWGRIMAIQCAVAFDNEDCSVNLLRAVKHASTAKATLEDWRVLRDFDLSRLPITPWENKT
jgi:hypothetical protein